MVSSRLNSGSHWKVTSVVTHTYLGCPEDINRLNSTYSCNLERQSNEDHISATKWFIRIYTLLHFQWRVLKISPDWVAPGVWIWKHRATGRRKAWFQTDSSSLHTSLFPSQVEIRKIYNNEWMLRKAIRLLTYAYYFSLSLRGQQSLDQASARGEMFVTHKKLVIHSHTGLHDGQANMKVQNLSICNFCHWVMINDTY